MRKIFVALFILIIATSCSERIIPKAINTVNAVSLQELNLERKDYRILNTVTAEATVHYSTSFDGKTTIIQCPEDNFAYKSTIKKSISGKVKNQKHEFRGVAKLGYLANDYIANDTQLGPEEIARRLAIYKLINEAKLAGADGIIEPIISTNVSNGTSAREVVYKTTVSAKLIKLNTDK